MRGAEELKAAGWRGRGLGIMHGKPPGSSYTSDFTAEGISLMVRQAMELAQVTTEDPHLGLPDPSELGSLDADLSLYCSDVAQMETPFKIELAKQAEAAALDADPPIANSGGASFDNNVSRNAFANSLRSTGSYRSSSCSLSAVPVAREGESMERDYWFSLSRSFAGLEKPATIRL